MENKKLYWIIGALLLVVGGAWYFGFFGGEKDEGLITLNCYDSSKQPIDCGNLKTMAIVSGSPAIRYIAYTFNVQNTGNVDINSYLKTITCKVGGVSNAACETSFNTIRGATYTKLIAKTATGSWAGSMIDLEPLAAGDYTIFVEACGKDTANQFTEVCKQGTKTISLVTGIDFTVDIT